MPIYHQIKTKSRLEQAIHKALSHYTFTEGIAENASGSV